MSEEINELRYSVEPGDIPGALRVVVDDYEQSGDMIIRALALEHRYPGDARRARRGARGSTARGSRTSSSPICRRAGPSARPQSHAWSCAPTSTPGSSCAVTWVTRAPPPTTTCSPRPRPSRHHSRRGQHEPVPDRTRRRRGQHPTDTFGRARATRPRARRTDDRRPGARARGARHRRGVRLVDDRAAPLRPRPVERPRPRLGGAHADGQPRARS